MHTDTNKSGYHAPATSIQYTHHIVSWKQNQMPNTPLIRNVPYHKILASNNFKCIRYVQSQWKSGIKTRAFKNSTSAQAQAQFASRKQTINIITNIVYNVNNVYVYVYVY